MSDKTTTHSSSNIASGHGNPFKCLPRPIAMLFLAALSSRLSQASMAPVYGSFNVSANHRQAMAATVILGVSLRLLNLTNIKTKAGEVRGPSRIRFHMSILAFWIPFIELQLSKHSSYLGVVAGPILTGLLTCHALIIPSAYVAAEELENLRLHELVGSVAEGILLSAACAALFLGFEGSLSQWLPHFPLKYTELSPVVLQVAVATFYALLAPSWLGLLGAVAVWQMLYSNPHYSSFALQVQLGPYGNWSVIDRRWSNTGYISVIDDEDRGVRFLRCDHSILGGEWLLTEERRKKEGWTQNEPIYSVFEMLEAVRLVERDDPVSDAEAQALVIGLGIGTAPKALIQHGINTTIVELDPIVYKYASYYFSLPSDHDVVIEDAVAWSSAQIARHEKPEGEMAEIERRYDYIIHDVFTGGSEPLDLFTMEFLTNLRTLLRPGGIIAVNYAGVLDTPLTNLVLDTVDLVFGRSCKMFSDSTEVAAKSKGRHESGKPEDSSDDLFSNLVIFCRKTLNPYEHEGDALAQVKPITFRSARTADYLGTISRRHYLVPEADQEVEYSWGGAWTLLEDTECGYNQPDSLIAENVWMWESEVQQSARRHWDVMRRVLPAKLWELY